MLLYTFIQSFLTLGPADHDYCITDYSPRLGYNIRALVPCRDEGCVDGSLVPFHEADSSLAVTIWAF